MRLAQSKITTQGRTSIPAVVRKKLGITPGSMLQWDEEGDKVVVRRAGKYSFEDIHRAIFKRPPKPKTLEELKEGLAQSFRDRYGRWRKRGDHAPET
jgi:antitoxin PrlF